MEKEIFVSNVRQQFIDAEEIVLEMSTEFRQLDSYDSLTGMTIMVMIKDEYGVDISESDYRAKKTVQELYEYVLAKTEKVMDAYINGISYYLPEKAITNDELQEIFPEWEVDKVASRIGVEKRYLSSTTEFTSDLAIASANKLIEDYNIDKSSVDYLIICSQTPDYLLPATSCIVQDKTGLPKSIGALDINLGCSGYIYGLGFAKGLIFSGQAKNIIFVTSETLTKFIHQDDKANRALFGDAATATFITSEPNKDFFLQR
ncbi:phosphopantetheine-binding protein [Flavobacterium ginsengisoli]|nr:phosphopantetheine-binding protein [Flavobacterium ginsengisoli]